jgi:hypothetical protein
VYETYNVCIRQLFGMLPWLHMTTKEILLTLILGCNLVTLKAVASAQPRIWTMNCLCDRLDCNKQVFELTQRERETCVLIVTVSIPYSKKALNRISHALTHREATQAYWRLRLCASLSHAGITPSDLCQKFAA